MNIKDMKRGEWMSGDVKPEAPGVYERRKSNGVLMYSKWAGKHWCRGWPVVRLANIDRRVAPNQYLSWRGQLEYDPHNAPDGYVAEPGKCRECDLYKVEFLCKAANCMASRRFDGRHVIMKRAKP